jgi:CTP synthase (UTP-ammonia lyase)
MIRIGVVGNYRDDSETHRATDAAVEHAAEGQGWTAEVTWIPIPDLEGTAAQMLARFHALWIAPGSPYQSMQGALDAITYARTRDIRCLALAAASSTWSSSLPATWWASPTPSTPSTTRLPRGC